VTGLTTWRVARSTVSSVPPSFIFDTTRTA
jgi:hypothetical protein